MMYTNLFLKLLYLSKEEFACLKMYILECDLFREKNNETFLSKNHYLLIIWIYASDTL